MSAVRTRNWVTIVYPESAPPDWQRILSETCIPACVSPLHDKDINPDGEPKKPHYHVILKFSGVKSINQVMSVCEKFGGIRPQTLENVPGYCRYLIHLDNPEKYQYSREDILNFSGFDWSQEIKTPTDRYKALKEITQFIQKMHMFSYSELVNYCRDNNQLWFETCTDNTVFLREYCKSSDWTHKVNCDVFRPQSNDN